MELHPQEPFLALLYGVLYGINYKDLVLPICIFFWAFVLFVSLAGIDLKDGITASTFVAFVTIAATLIILAIPQDLAETESPQKVVTILGGAGIFALVKWLMSYRNWMGRLRFARAQARRKIDG